MGENGGHGASRSNSISSMFYLPSTGTRTTSTLAASHNFQQPQPCPQQQNSITIHATDAISLMGAMAVRRRQSSAFGNRKNVFAKSMTEQLSAQWIERVFQKRECIKFIPDENSDRCGCGRLSSAHSQLALSRFTTAVTRPSFVNFSKKWNILDHTAPSPTDAYGRIEFQGGTHAHKAHYLRLAFDSDPANVMHLMEKVWSLQRPRLVITIHGGMTNFRVADKLGRLFREGMLKAAETTGAWILTSGVDSGVVRHVAKALDEAGISARMRSKVVTIGIAPWGLLRRREKLVGRDANIPYDRHSFLSRSRYAVLNDRHSYFLLVDNGTVGRYGADIVFRKRFEEFLAEKQTLYCGGAHRIPIVCLALEGGLYTLNSIHEYLTRQPAAVPVLICEGSGRVSDLLAFAERNLNKNGNLPMDIGQQLLEMVRSTLNYESTSSEEIYAKIIDCVRHLGLLTVFRLYEDSSNDVDHVILRALLTGQILSLQDQLSLTLAWDRVDIARSEVLQDGRDWSMHSLHDCMMDALLLNRVEFVKLLLENGLSLKKFLTFGRLEKLYNSDSEHLSTLYHLIGEKASPSTGGEDDPGFTLPEIGTAIEKLMGNAYRCYYTTRSFKSRYDRYRGKQQLKRVSSFVGNLHLPTPSAVSAKQKRSKKKKRNAEDSPTTKDFDFRFPFNDLMLWAVLTRRHAMAKCIWQYGEEAMAKALMAIRLYKCMSKEAADDYTEVEVSNQLREYADEFRECSLELLSHCYQQDDLMTMRLLTAELPNWGHHTCLSLAVIANNKRFLAHPCCQILLAELWHGGLRFRSQSNIKVVLAILFPPTILLLDFKTFAQQKFTARAKRHQHLVDDSDTTANDLDSDALQEDSDEYGESIGERKQYSISSRFAAMSKKKKDSLHSFFRRTSASFMGNGSGESATAPGNDRSASCNESPQRQRLHPFQSMDEEAAEKNVYSTGADEDTVESDSEMLTHSSPTVEMSKAMSAAKRVYIVSAKRDSTAKESTRLSRQISSTSTITNGRLKGLNIWNSRLLNCFSKFVLFYRAPITSFWIWTISFCIFMLFLIYVLLIEFPPEVSWLEYLLFAYVLGLGMEHFRKLLILESSSFMEKMRVFYNRYWNILTSFAVLTYFVGFALRFSKPSIHTYSRIILASNSLLWHMKLFDYLSVHPRIGPYITMAGKMIMAMSYIIVMLLVTLMAFGVVRQSITFPHEKWSWILVRNIFYKPYFMLYGEVYAGEIDTCGDEGTNCVPGGWIPPFIMVIFLLVANILLINMLIAIFNNIFNVTNAMSQQVWMFQRYEQVLEYKSTPIVPPPLTPIIHLCMLFRYFCQSKMCRRRRRVISSNSSVDFAIKIYLDEGELKKLHDFEEDCMDDLSRRKTLISTTQSQHHHIRECVEGVEEMSYQLGELIAENSSLKMQMNELMNRFERFESSQKSILGNLTEKKEEESQETTSSAIERPKYLLKSHGGTFSNAKRPSRLVPRARVPPVHTQNQSADTPATPSTIPETEICTNFAQYQTTDVFGQLLPSLSTSYSNQNKNFHTSAKNSHCRNASESRSTSNFTADLNEKRKRYSLTEELEHMQEITRLNSSLNSLERTSLPDMMSSPHCSQHPQQQQPISSPISSQEQQENDRKNFTQSNNIKAHSGEISRKKSVTHNMRISSASSSSSNSPVTSSYPSVELLNKL